nr:hypothetical protein [Candidatus Gracilibacteria bacterium]
MIYLNFRINKFIGRIFFSLLLIFSFFKVDASYYIYDYPVTIGSQISCPLNPDVANGGKLTFDFGTGAYDGQSICGTTVTGGKYVCSGFADINNDGNIDSLDYTSTESSQKIGPVLPGNVMKCVIIDSFNPAGTLTYYNGNTNANQDITVNASDIGGSKLSKIELYENKNNAGFAIATTIDVSGQDTATGVWTRTVSADGDYYQYKAIVYDRAGNSITLNSSNIIFIDITPIPVNGWYNFHLMDIASGCDDDGDITGGEFQFDFGTGAYDGQSICGTTVSGGKYMCDHAADIDNNKVISSIDFTSTELSPKIGPVLSGSKMDCAMYDIQVPENLTLDYLYYLSGSTVTINLSAKDRGGSTLDRMILYRKEGLSPWVTLKTWAGIVDTTNTVISETYTDTVPNINSKYKYYLRVYDVAGNYTDLPGHEIILDNTPPTVSDIGTTNPLPLSNLLATNSQNFSFTVSDAGGSPINYIGSFFEDYTTLNSFKSEEVAFTGTWSYNENIQNVDIDRTANGSRQYMLRVSKVCDAAGNCLGSDVNTSNLVTYTYNVYSNSLNVTTKTATSNLSDSTNIADGSIKNLTITLKDAYGNIIIPATGISRTIDFNFDVTNTMYLNQYLRSGGKSIYADRTTNVGNYLNTRLPGGITSLNAEVSTDGTYTYGFKVYTPTSNQNNLPLSDKDGIFNINSITFDVNGTLGANVGQLVGSSNIISKFSPLYYTKIAGDIINDGLIEGSIQSSSIQVAKNASAESPTGVLHIEFGSGNTNVLNPNLNLEYGTVATSVNNNVGEGNGNYINFVNNFGIATYPIYTKLLLQTGASLSDIQNSYISTHISYNITAPNGVGVVTPIYNSDVYGKDSYWGVTGTGNTYESVVKIIGKTYSDKYSDVITGQSITDVSLVDGTITKSSLRGEIKKNVYDIIKFIDPNNNGTKKINNLTDFALNTDGVKLMQNSILYFGGLNGGIVTLNGGTVTGNKTIVIEGGNLYINGNINTNGTSNDVLGIVVMKDSNGNGGNIYIDPNVSYIKSIMYADKSLISYDGTNELGGDTSFGVLKNQLYIYGSIFSENTIGGSRSNPIKCPYYINTCTSIEEAQKYDLDYLRRYYLKDTNGDGIGDTPAGGGVSYFPNTSSNYKYPLVVEYNPLIQVNPPVVFKQ